jgi:peptidyl-prolyl cis-trans isomerase B (cyclophilin B)
MEQEQEPMKNRMQARAVHATGQGMRPMFFCCLLVCSLGLANVRAQDAAKASPQKPTTDQKEVALLETSDGTMVLEFWPEVAPQTVVNFKKLAREGFYNGTLFHRVVAGFMIQGGDPLTKDPSKEALWGQGGPSHTVPAEFSNRPHLRGVISMARQQDPNSAGSQFFICLDSVRRLDGKYTNFGQVIKGLDVLDKIGQTPVTRGPDGELSRPKQPVVLESVKIVPAEAVK